MADAMEQLLLRMGIDLSPAKSAAAELKNILGQLNDLSSQVEAKTKQAVTGQKAALDDVKAAAASAVADAKASIAAESAKTAALKTQTAEYQKQKAESSALAEASRASAAAETAKKAVLATETAELAKQRAERVAETAEIQKQIAELRKRKAEESGERGRGEEGGFFSKAAGSVAKGFLGGGILGSVATGVIAGQAISQLVEVAGEGIEKFIDRLKEMKEESSQLTLVEDQFERLAKAAGVDAPEAILKLHEATEGVVDRLTLLKTAVMALKSPFGVTMEQVTQLSGAAVKLAESSGHTAAEAMNGLQRMLTTGYARSLMFAVGLSKVSTQLDDIAPTATRAERGILQIQKAEQLLIDAQLKLGETPQTLEQMITRWEVAWHDLEAEFARGFNLSAGTQVAIQALTGFSNSIEGLAEKAKNIGMFFGDSMLVVTTAAKSGTATLKALWDVISGILSTASGVLGIANAFGNVSNVGGEAVVKFRALHPVLYQTVDGIARINLELQVLLIRVGSVVDKLATALPGGIGAGLGYTLGAAGGAFATGLTGTEVGAAAGPIGALVGGAVGIGAGALLSRRKQQQGQQQGGQWKPLTVDEQIQQAYDNYKKLISGIAEAYTKAENEHGETRELPLGKQDDTIRTSEKIQEEKRLLQERLQWISDEKNQEAALNKERLAQQEEDIQYEKQMDEQSYRSAEESLEQHLQVQRDLIAQDAHVKKAQARADFQNTIEEQNQQYQAKKQEMKDELELKKTQPGANQEYLNKQYADQGKALEEHYNTLSHTAEDQYQTKITQIETNTQHQLTALVKEGNAERFAALKDGYDKELEAKLSALQNQEALDKRAQEQGAISASDYVEKQLSNIQAMADAQVEAYNKTRDAAVANASATPKMLQDLTEQTRKAYQDAYQKIQQLQTQYGQMGLAEIERRNAPSQKSLEDQLGFKESQQDFSGRIELIQKMLQSIQEQRNELTALANSNILQPDEWLKAYQGIEQTWQATAKWTEELLKARDIMQPLAQGFAQIGQSIEENFHSKFAASLAANVQAGAKALQQSQSLGRQVAGLGVQKDAQTVALENQANTLFDKVTASANPLIQTFSDLRGAMLALMQYINTMVGGLGGPRFAVPANTAETQASINDLPPIGLGGSKNNPNNAQLSQAGGGNSPATAMSQLVNQLVAAAQAIGNFTEAILKSKNAISGGIGGALGGAGLGNTLNTALGGILGPLGSVVGGAVGGIVGAIVGSKNQAVTNNINQLQAQYTAIMQTYANNTNNLNQAILSLKSLLVTAQEMQASSKKGSSQYQQIINQYIQQIDQLQTQQLQIIVQMNEQVAQVTAPPGMQQYLSSLQQIMQQYEQFEGAAQNADQLAEATQYLVGALNQYEYNLQDQLLQDQQQAIQQAIQLNDLTYQQQQMILQYNDQVEGILSQGVLTRQLTRAQSAGEQIQQLQVQYTMQMENMNEQIAVTQAEVAAQSQIFNLASTRVGLEAQLVQVQNQQTTYDMQRIQALAQLVEALSTGNLSIVPSLTNLLSALPGVTNSAGQTASNPTDATDTLDALIAAAYQDRATLGYTQFNGTNL